MIEAKLVPVAQWGFGLTARLWLLKNFKGLYLDRESAFGGERAWPGTSQGPVFFFATHSSWLDPLAAAELTVNQQRLRVLAPMAASEFRRYKSLRFVGIFGVDKGDGREAEALVEREVAAHPETCFWITPQGAFAPNELPQPPFREGLSRWSNRAGRRRIPVAVHYHFGVHSKPLAFARFGPEQPPSGLSVREDAELLRRALEKEVQALLKRVYASQSGPQSDLSGFLKIL